MSVTIDTERHEWVVDREQEIEDQSLALVLDRTGEPVANVVLDDDTGLTVADVNEDKYADDTGVEVVFRGALYRILRNPVEEYDIETIRTHVEADGSATIYTYPDGRLETVDPDEWRNEQARSGGGFDATAR